MRLQRSLAAGCLVAIAACHGKPVTLAGMPEARITVEEGGAITLHDTPIQLSMDPPASAAQIRELLDDHDRDDASATPAAPAPKADGDATGAKPSAHPEDSPHPADSPHPERSESPKLDDEALAITYVAQTQPITSGAATLQADDIAIRGDRAYIGYNLAGPTFGGAIQIMDIHDRAHPTILDTIRFKDLKVNTVWLDGNLLLFGGGASPDGWPFRAFIGEIRLDHLDPAAILSGVKGLPSYATTSIRNTGGRIYAGVGAKDGGVAILDDQLNQTAFVPDADVRALDTYKDGVVALAGTTDAGAKATPTLDIIRTALVSQTPIHATLQDYGRAAVDIKGETLWTALSVSGVSAWDMKSLTTPAFALVDPGNSDLMTTNGVSSDGDFVYVANGEYGFRVLKQGGDHDKAFAHLIGFHELAGDAYGGQHYSANDIAVGGDWLFVASGVGAVNIYHLQKGHLEPSPSPKPDRDQNKGPAGHS